MNPRLAHLAAASPHDAAAAAPATSLAGAGAPYVVGLDLSLTATGIAHCDGHLVTCKTDTAAGDRRLITIEQSIVLAISGGPMTDGFDRPLPDLAVVEDLPTHAQGAGKTGMVHGVARALLIRFGIPYVLIPPATLKKYAVGKGNATKPDMRMALFQRAGLALRDDNQVDAWWLRAMGLDHFGSPPVDLPKVNREALGKVAWPEASAG